MDWKAYENITKYIYEALGKQAGVKIIGYGSDCKVKGKSGVSHQIDVLTSHTDGIHEYHTAIECKYWKEKVNKDVVMKLERIIEDAGIEKGVIVSKMGFTEDGFLYAKHKNIGLVELREIEERDWKEQAKKPDFFVGELIVNTKIERRRPEILSIEFDFVGSNQQFEKINHYQWILRSMAGIEIPLESYVTSFQDKLHREEPDNIVKENFEFKDGNLINTKTKTITRISGFTLTGKLTVTNLDSQCQFNIVDEVWMLMKSLFENRSFTISKSGMIKKDET